VPSVTLPERGEKPISILERRKRDVLVELGFIPRPPPRPDANCQPHLHPQPGQGRCWRSSHELAQIRPQIGEPVAFGVQPGQLLVFRVVAPEVGGAYRRHRLAPSRRQRRTQGHGWPEDQILFSLQVDVAAPKGEQRIGLGGQGSTGQRDSGSACEQRHPEGRGGPARVWYGVA
jgi:hypothetical protein